LAWSLRLRTDLPACAGCQPPMPGEVPSLSWTDGGGSALQWPAVPGAAWYRVYRGEPRDLPNLLTPALDACSRCIASTPGRGAALAEIPERGSMFWHVVRAASGAGEGPAGNATAGPLQQDSSGTCP